MAKAIENADGGGVNVEVDASFSKVVYVTPALLIATRRAVNISSLTLPEAGVKVVVIGFVTLSLVNEGSATLKFVKAAFTFAGVIADNTVGDELKLANHVLGLAVPTRFATSKSVRGLIFAVPATVATEV